MKGNSTLTILFFLLVQQGFSQNGKLLSGKIIVHDATSQGVHIINLVNETETISDARGNFTITANEDDVLVFSAAHLDLQRKIIEAKEYSSGSFTVEMTSIVNQLDEVTIANPHFDAVSLGILKKPAKEYTPAERRLRTAGDFKPIDLLGLLGGSMELDPVINAISGRTALLKKQIKIEQRERLLSKIDELYTVDVFTQRLKIPALFVSGFKHFIVEQDSFQNAIRDKDYNMAYFIMSQQAVVYNKQSKDEN